MFVLLGLLVSPERLVSTFLPALAVALVLMFVARPVAVFLCLCAVSVSAAGKDLHLLGRPARRGGDLPCLDPAAGRSAERRGLFRHRLRRRAGVAAGAGLDARLGGAAAARRAAARRAALRRVELDLPGQLEQELVGYLVRQNSLFLKRRVIPSWSKPTLIIRDEQIFTPAEAEPVVAGDYVYLLAPPEKAEALDRFFIDMPAGAARRSAHARRLHGAGRRHARQSRRDLWRSGRPGAGRADARRLFRHQSRSCAEDRRHAADR